MKISYKRVCLIYKSAGIALVRENGGAMGVRLGINKMRVETQLRQNSEHMVAGLEENKRQDFAVNSIQGQELEMTEFEHGTWVLGISEVMWGWQKRVLESRTGQKLISKSFWVLWDVTVFPP